MTDPSGMAWMDDLVVAKEQLDQIRELLGIDDPSINVAETLGKYLRLIEGQTQAAEDHNQALILHNARMRAGLAPIFGRRPENEVCPHGLHFGGHYCDECEAARGGGDDTDA